MKPGSTEFELVSPSVNEEIVIQIETFVRTVNEARGIAHGALNAGKTHLRISGIPQIRIDATQDSPCSKIVPFVNAALAAGNIEKTKPNFVQDICREEMRVVERQVISLRTDVSAEAGYKRLVQRTRAK